MCARYVLDMSGPEALTRIVEEVNRRSPEASVKTGVISPSDTAPVIARSRRGNRGAFAMKWGYKAAGGRLIFNARSETAGEKPLFRDGMAQRRCLVPASWYYEWEHRDGGTKARYEIGLPDMAWMYLAGIYRLEPEGPAFTVLTREPVEQIRFIHDRMPVILPPQEAEDWIDPVYDARDLLTHAAKEVAFRLSVREKEAGA